MNRSKQYASRPAGDRPIEFANAQQKHAANAWPRDTRPQSREISQIGQRGVSTFGRPNVGDLPSRTPPATQCPPPTQHTYTISTTKHPTRAPRSAHSSRRPLLVHDHSHAQPATQKQPYIWRHGDFDGYGFAYSYQGQSEEDVPDAPSDDTSSRLEGSIFSSANLRSGEKHADGWARQQNTRGNSKRSDTTSACSRTASGAHKSLAEMPWGTEDVDTSERSRRQERTEQKPHGSLAQMAALSLTNQQLEKEKRQLCAKVKDTEARLKQTLEKELEQEKTLRTKEKSLQRLRSALDKVQANSKHLRSLHASAKEAINGSICGAREDLNTIKSEAETSRQATEKALEGLNLIRIRIKSLSDSANLSTGLYETRLQELKIKCMDSEQRLEAEKAHCVQLVQVNDILCKAMGGDGEGFGSALKSLQDSGLLSPNIIRTLNDKIVGLEERNEKLLRDCRNADRERHEAIKAKEKVEDARMVEHSRAAKEVVRLQEALDVSRDETTLARKQLKDGEIRTREAQAGANAALAAMQVSLDQALQARNVAQQEIARHESTSTAAHEAQAVAEALAAERLTQVSRLTNDLDRTYKELDRLKSARGRLSATANKFKVTTARDSLLGEKLAHSERQSLEFQKRIEKLERELEDQAIAHAFELAEREDAMEIAHSSALAEFVARLDSNKLIEGDKDIVEQIRRKMQCVCDNENGRKVQRPGKRKDSRKDETPACRTLAENNTTIAKETNPPAALRRKRKRVTSPTVSGYSDDNGDRSEGRKVEKKTAEKAIRFASPPHIKASSPESSLESAEQSQEYDSFGDHVLSPALRGHASAPHQPVPSSQHQRHKATRKRS